jgi:hypothetical protein
MKKLLLNVLTGITALGITSSALADVSVSLEPSHQTINEGSLASMDLVISGLGDHSSPSLGAFDFNLSYNPAILSGLSVLFGTHLDLGILGSAQFADLSTPGVIQLDEVSFESAAALNAAQPSSFTLATLSFKGIGPGVGMINFTAGSLSDENGATLPFTTVAGQINVNGPALIPEASFTAALLLATLFGLESLRRKLLAKSL